MAAMERKALRPKLAGLGHRSDATERPLISLLQSSTRQDPLRIIEPPFRAADHLAVIDPNRTATLRRADVHCSHYSPMQ
jgi:hypothetical protein